jgi:hypothetical protein
MRNTAHNSRFRPMSEAQLRQVSGGAAAAAAAPAATAKNCPVQAIAADVQQICCDIQNIEKIIQCCIL